MSVTEADMMTVLGETQQVMSGDNQQTAEYSAAVQRQYDYQQAQAAEFGTSLGPQALDTAVSLITGNATGLIGAFSSVPSPSPVQIFQQEGGIIGAGVEPQVNFPRPGSPIYVPGTAPTGTPNVPVVYEPLPVTNPGPWAFGIGGIGAILTGVIGSMWPSPIGGGDTFGRSEEARHEGREHPLPSRPEDIVFGPVPDIDVMGPPIPGGPGGEFDRENPPLTPTPGAPYDFGDAFDRAQKAMEDQLIKDMTTPAPAPAPPPAPAPAPGPSLPPWVWPLIGGLGAIQLGRAGRGRRSDFTLPTPGFDLTVINEPLLPSESIESRGTSSPGFLSTTQAGSGGVWDLEQASDPCNCHRKAGKKRKCLAKAQLSWRSGPKKGRAAGSRCYRFAD